MLYITECWVTNVQHASKMSVVVMMLRWMCGETLRDKIRNEKILEVVGAAL